MSVYSVYAVDSATTAYRLDSNGAIGNSLITTTPNGDNSSPSSWSTDSCTPRWWFRASCRAGVSGRPAQTRICRGDGQECSVEARRRNRNAASAPTLAAQRKDRTYLWGSPLRGWEVAMPAPCHYQSRGCPRG